MVKEGIDKSNKEWVITSTKDSDPEALSEIGILTNDDYFTIDQIVGRDFAVEINKWEDPLWDKASKEIVLNSIDDLIVLFHEVGHAVVETEKRDNPEEEILRKIQAKILTGRDVSNFDPKEVEELICIGAERVASAHALRKIREIKKRGIDLLNGVSFEEIRAKIHLALNSHFNKIRNTKEYKEKLKKLSELLGLTGKKR